MVDTLKLKLLIKVGHKILSVNNSMEDLPISISIIDNGNGIPDDLIDKILNHLLGTEIEIRIRFSGSLKLLRDHGGFS